MGSPGPPVCPLGPLVCPPGPPHRSPTLPCAQRGGGSSSATGSAPSPGAAFAPPTRQQVGEQEGMEEQPHLRLSEGVGACLPRVGKGRGESLHPPAPASKGELLSQAQAGAGEPASKQPISFEVRLSPRAAQARSTRGWRKGNGRRWLCLLSQLESKRGRFVSTLPVKTGAGDSDVPAERPYVGSVPW